MAEQATNTSKIKRLPKGVSDFRHTMEDNRYYVDKTMFLPILEEADDFLLLVRPRRFGKSLFVSMMKDYYDINRKDKFQEEFKGLWIAEHPTELQGYFQVLHFDFSLVNQSLGTTLEEKFNNYCCREINSFIRYYSSFYDKDTVERVLNFASHGDKIGEMTNAAKENGQHVYLIIDEYDNFTNTALSEQGEDYYHSLTHAAGFYREAFKAYKPNFERIFLVGVSPLTLTDLTSGFNIATNISHYESVNAIVGFSEQEVENMIEYYRSNGVISQTTEEIMNELRPWYDGYCFAKTEIDNSGARMYNSSMVLYYLSELIARKLPPEDLVDSNSATDFNKLRQIIEIDEKNSRIGHNILEEVSVNGYAVGELKNKFSALEMTQIEFLPSLMYYYGMLTWGKNKRGDVALVIPNLNARKQYYDYMSLMITRRVEIDNNELNHLVHLAGEEGDWRRLFEYVAERYHENSNVRIEKDGEKAVQLYMLGMLNTIKCFITLLETEMNGGYCDLFMLPQTRVYPKLRYCYVVELKYVKPDATDAEVEAKMQEARKQVARYAASPNAKRLSQGTQIHPIVMLFKGTQLLQMEEVK